MGLHEGDAEKAELLNRQFHTAFSSKEQSTEEEFATRCPMPQLDPTRPLCEDINITVSGIEKLLKQLSPTKASRPDNISPRVLKEVASEIAPSLILIYRASIKSGTVPKDWKSAHTAPRVHERKLIQAWKLPAHLLLTRRPCKLLEHVVVSTTMGYVEKH